jgi:hypothetical protein
MTDIPGADIVTPNNQEIRFGTLRRCGCGSEYCYDNG